MKTKIIDGFEITTDGRTVWVNSRHGMCVGRFSHVGVDVHNDYEAQRAGAGECLDCVHGLPPLESWNRFVDSMRTHYAVVVPSRFRPDFVGHDV